MGKPKTKVEAITTEIDSLQKTVDRLDSGVYGGMRGMDKQLKDMRSRIATRKAELKDLLNAKADENTTSSNAAIKGGTQLDNPEVWSGFTKKRGGG